MFRKFIFTLIFFFILSQQTYAKIDIVYPTSKDVKVKSASLFFIGNTDYGSVFSINSESVQLWEDNFFVHVVPLQYGRNEIKMVSYHHGEVETLTYYVTRLKTSPAAASYSYSSYTYLPSLQKTKTVKSNATVREKPSVSSSRIIDLPEGVVLYLSAKKGDFYKIAEYGETEYWIHKSNISTPQSIEVKEQPVLSGKYVSSDDKYDYVTFNLSYPVFYTLKQNGNSVDLTLYGVQADSANNYRYTFSTDRTIIGYDAYYQGNNLVFRIAKIPDNFDEKNPLKGITVFVDPGHGGEEKGSVGPSRVPEKDINLYISRYLTEYLKRAGAIVIMSRNDDRKVPLYDRVKMAKNNNAIISLSIHSNALPNGYDPYENHGTEVHYYNENAKQLADIIKNNLVYDVHLKDNGVRKSSFALNRSTNPVSVLVEVAYMINPQEYILLKSPEFQENVAKSIKKSLEQYIFVIKK